MFQLNLHNKLEQWNLIRTDAMTQVLRLIFLGVWLLHQRAHTHTHRAPYTIDNVKTIRSGGHTMVHETLLAGLMVLALYFRETRARSQPSFSKAQGGRAVMGTIQFCRARTTFHICFMRILLSQRDYQ